MTVTSLTFNSFTDQQRQAIETRQVSVSLSAGAGCGKTFVLTERFLAQLDRNGLGLDPNELLHLVAITFTERAAREMRDRIRQKCYERLIASEPAEAEKWSELLRSLDSARISTIHSFCGSLLRSRAVEAGLDPGFEVLEQAQADTLFSEVIDDCLRQLVASHDELTFRLAARFDLNHLREMIRSLVIEGAGDQFERWLKISPAEQVASWETFHRETVMPAIASQIVQSPASREIVAILQGHVPENPVMQARRAILLEKLASPFLEGLNSARIGQELDEIREAAKVQGGGSAKSWSDAQAYEAFKEAATVLRKLIDKVRLLVDFDSSTALEAAVIGQELLSIAAEIHGSYTAKKQSLGVLDFNDLLVRARQILVDSRHDELRKRLSSQIHLLLVDEFQDTDPLQVELLKALCGKGIFSGKLFFVGDYKQSIYRFRGAEAGVFRNLRQEIPVAGRLSLTQNFRSQPAILEFVNALFRDDLGSDYEPLRPTRHQVSAKPAIEFLWAAALPGARENSQMLRRREADWIARRVRAMLDSRAPIVWDADAAKSGKPAARPAQPGDFAILFRALSDVQLYEEALRNYEIDYYLVGGHAFYAQQEIFDLLNLLRALNSPSDVVSLVGVLRSGFFSLTDETIFWLSQHPEGLPDGLLAEPPAEVSQDQQQRVRFAVATIGQLRELKDRIRICDLIELALTRTGYDASLLHEFLGERKLANLRKVVSDARDFDRTGLFALSDFIAQLSEFVARQPKEPLAATHSENSNVVRLMTIHQSKGLEFPIVIVPDLDRPTKNQSGGVVFDARLGPLVKLRDDNAESTAISGYDLWQVVEKTEELNELYRLLYVATTRAADYLMLSSGIGERNASRKPWMDLLARRFDVSTGRLIAALPAGEPVPAVTVTSQEPAVNSGGTARRKRVDMEAVIREVLEAPTKVGPAIEPIAPDLSARKQYSFSRLAGTLHRQDQRDSDDSASGPASADPRGLGTLVHAVLAEIDFAGPLNIESIKGLVQLHAQRQLSTSDEVDEAAEMIEQFVASPRARSIAEAQQSHAEVEFLLGWPLDVAGPPTFVLKGYIDRLYQDDAGQWHIVDFKTNRVTPRNLSSQAASYEMQMLVYALATETILGVPPQSLTLHFLRTGEEHSFAWDAAARERLVALVEQGIAVATARQTTAGIAAYR